MKPLLIGSTALAYQLDKLNISHNIKPLDTDLIVADKYESGAIVTFLKWITAKTVSVSRIDKFGVVSTALKFNDSMVEIVYPEKAGTSTDILIKQSTEWDDTYVFNGIECTVAPLSVLMSLKWSHRFLRNSPHFLKTRIAIKNLQRLKIAPHDSKWVEMRINETYDYSHPNLKVKKEDFFNSNFNYVYDHDSIHEAVKLLDKPAYTFYMSADEEVQCSKELFFSQENTIRLLGVLEETYVLALERSQIPNNFNIDPRVSFNIALEKVCTSITSGWFREYAWENYDIVSRMYDSSYVDKFKHALKMRRILPYKGNY